MKYDIEFQKLALALVAKTRHMQPCLAGHITYPHIVATFTFAVTVALLSDTFTSTTGEGRIAAGSVASETLHGKLNPCNSAPQRMHRVRPATAGVEITMPQ